VPPIYIVSAFCVGLYRRLESPGRKYFIKEGKVMGSAVSIEQAALFMLAMSSPTNQEVEHTYHFRADITNEFRSVWWWLRRNIENPSISICGHTRMPGMVVLHIVWFLYSFFFLSSSFFFLEI
jgi:hypothetical protein